MSSSIFWVFSISMKNNNNKILLLKTICQPFYTLRILIIFFEYYKSFSFKPHEDWSAYKNSRIPAESNYIQNIICLLCEEMFQTKFCMILRGFLQCYLYIASMIIFPSTRQVLPLPQILTLKTIRSSRTT